LKVVILNDLEWHNGHCFALFHRMVLGDILRDFYTHKGFLETSKEI